MSFPPFDDDFDRLRTEALRLRSVLMDRTTGLPAVAVLGEEIRGLLESRRHVGVLHVEASDLELVESLYGWQIFDRVVARIGSVLEGSMGAALPAGSLLGVHHVGSGRFVAFVPTTPDGALVNAAFLERTADALRGSLETAFDAEEMAGLSPRLTFRAGHALLSENPFFRFERRLDSAIEQARTLHARRESHRDVSWEAELRRIIAESAVTTVFQPVVDLGSGAVVGYEALSRGPSGGEFESPRALFGVGERFGLAHDLDRVCWTSALRAVRDLPSRATMFVNVLPASLADPDWEGGGIASLLRELGVEPSQVVVEISERRSDSDPDLLVRSSESIRRQGFGLALDDVGTGYGTLGTLDRVGPDYLKMDVSLVRGVHASFIKQDILSALVKIGRRLGAVLVAEGIESADETATLRAAGAQLGQGFLYHRPRPISSEAPGPGSEREG